MSLERVINSLVNLGISRSDAEVYVILGKKGPQKVADLIRSLNYSKNQINSSLKNLTNKELVKKDGTVFHFCKNKCQKNMLDLKRIPRRVHWTKYYTKK